MGVLPVHAPAVAVNVPPTTAAPAVVGAEVFLGIGGAASTDVTGSSTARTVVPVRMTPACDRRIPLLHRSSERYLSFRHRAPRHAFRTELADPSGETCAAGQTVRIRRQCLRSRHASSTRDVETFG